MNLAQALMAAMSGGDLRFVTSVESTTSTIVVPNTNIGDLLVLVDYTSNITSTIPTLVTPPGFTSINSVTGATSGGSNGSRANMSYMLVSSSMSGTTLAGMTGAFRSRKILMVFRGISPFATATPLSAAGQIINGAPTNQVIPVNGESAPLIALSHSYDNLSMTGGTLIAHSLGTYAGYRLYKDTPSADVTCSVVSSTLALLQSCYIQLTY